MPSLNDIALADKKGGIKLIDSIAKSKRNELILNLQGSEMHPKLKLIRESFLDIKTSVELAEILDVTRQTMSKLEKCTNKLSGAQYLAICSLIEKKKNELLQKLDSDDAGKKEKKNTLDKLLMISVFYKREFLLNIIRWLFYIEGKKDNKNREIIASLRKITCLDNWLDTLDYNEVISSDKEKFINCDTYVDLSSFNEIRDLISILDIHSSPANISKGKIYFIYNDLKNLLDDIRDRLDSRQDLNYKDDIVNFVGKISSLIKSNKAELVNYNKLTGSIVFSRSQTVTESFFSNTSCELPPSIIVVQDEKMAKEIKLDTMYAKKLKPTLLNYFTELTYRNMLKNIEICKFENNTLKRWLFDYESLLKELNNMSDEEKQQLADRRVSEVNLIDDSSFEETLNKLDTYSAENKSITSDMKLVINEKLKMINKLIFEYNTPYDIK